MVAGHLSLTRPLTAPLVNRVPLKPRIRGTGPPWGRFREAGFTREPEGALEVSLSNPPVPDPILQMRKPGLHQVPLSQRQSPRVPSDL